MKNIAIKNFLTLFIILTTLTIFSTEIKLANPHYTIDILTGNELTEFLPFVAQQRIIEFQLYPYLYAGSPEYEISYLRIYNVIAVIYCDQQPVGFLTGTSLIESEPEFKGVIQLFEQADLHHKDYFYFGEIIVLPEHRGNSLGKKLFKALEEYAYNHEYRAGCFITESHETHPLKPKNYKSHDDLWNSMGYVKSKLSLTLEWLTIQEDGSRLEQSHSVDYWLKNFQPSCIKT